MLENLTTESLVMTIGSVLVAVVGMLWKEFKANYKATKDELLDYKTKQEATDERLLQLTEKVGYVTGHQKGVEEVAAEVIKQVKQEKQ